MELWEKKLRNAIRTEIRGLVNEGRLDLSAVAESLELDVSDLIAEDDAKDWAEPNNPQGDGGQSEDSSGRGQASGPESATRVAEGDGDDDLDEDADAEDEIVAERWARLAGLIRG